MPTSNSPGGSSLESGDEPKKPPRKGWGWPTLSRKAHYFYEGRSLCGKWGFFGDVSDANAEVKGPDDCAACRRKWDATYKPKGTDDAATK